MFANYHTHTFRCGHASGADEEYIERAIACGITEMGFSDHAPFAFPDGHESGHRVPTALAEDYISSLKALREKYKDKIKLHIGFELEYYPLFFEGIIDYLKKLGAEYLILGQHFLGNELGNAPHSMAGSDSAEQLSEYVDCVTKAIKTGKFTYIAHPDVFYFTGDSAVYRREMLRLCETAKEYDTPLEINFWGLFDNRIYPTPEFWELAAKTGNKVIFGSDAHTPERAFDAESLKKAEALVKKYNLNLIDRVDIKAL